ncbi:hypothetical protein MMC26_005586 [Xylographa opegraphella]|nr:hypothetical protein [Xylographa opegraphella]
MVTRKRGRAEMESTEVVQEIGLLVRLRNMWEFANIMQYIFIFGKAVKIDEDFDNEVPTPRPLCHPAASESLSCHMSTNELTNIQDLEAECLKPGPSDKLAEIGLCLLKFVSSHRGLTPELFDEYTRRQYVAKAPSRNPFGTDEVPNKFAEFDIFTKLRVLVQLSQWTLINADRMREKMSDTKDVDQTQWRIEELGYDRQERLYFVLDDNRLYRRTDPSIPEPPTPTPKPKAKPKPKSKAGKAAARASKRRKTTEADEVKGVEDDPEADTETKEAEPTEVDDGFGGRKWECLAVTLTDYETFLEGIQKSRDPDEKALYSRLTKEVMPVIEKMEEDRQKKIARRQKELMNLEKLATAKRSSRLASKQEREREEQEILAAERKRQADLIEAKRDAERQKQMDEARESRMMTREQRLKEREYKRLLHEEELANLSEDNKKLEAGEARMSERHLKAEMEKKKRELEKLAQDDEWIFDCSDDGSHSVACEECNVWQHSSCLGISQADAEKEDFHFICNDCKRKREDAKKPKIPPLKFKVGSSSSPPSDKSILYVNGDNQSTKRKLSESEHDPTRMPPSKMFKPYFAPATGKIGQNSNVEHPTKSEQMHQSFMNGPTLAPQGQLPSPQGTNGYHVPPPGLVSPVRPGSYGSNVHQNRLPTSSPPYQPQSSLANGTRLSSAGFSGAVRPNGYHTALSPQYSQHEKHQPSSSTGYQDPFHNSFERQHPVSSQLASDIVSPRKDRSSIVLAQEKSDVGPLSLSPSASEALNGTGLPHYRPASATHPSAYSPQKAHYSPAPATPFTSSSSPLIPPLISQSNMAMSGLSPSKNSPPRPPPDHGVSRTPIMPPAAHLFPSPQPQNLHAPVKGMTPEQTKMANGPVKGE